MNVAVLEAAHDLHDRVNFANVMEKLIAQSFTCACAFDQAGNIDKLDRGRHDLLRMRNFR